MHAIQRQFPRLASILVLLGDYIDRGPASAALKHCG